ncbi:MAG TPA: hypothetical protein HA224_03290 [Nanoarchaeota archaeon]|nr:hypothetical protein [Nanoarchaeota archaeon]
MTDAVGLERFVGSHRYERFMSGEQAVIDMRNIALVAAERNGWHPALEELLKGQIETTDSSGNTQAINLAKRISGNKYIDDPTAFRPYFTVLFALKYLTEKFNTELGEEGFSGITAHTVAHYTNISISDIYRCLGRLAREGFAEKGNTHNLERWMDLKKKVRETKKRDAKKLRFEKEKQDEVLSLQKAYADVRHRLSSVDCEHLIPELDAAESQRISEIESNYNATLSALKTSLSQEAQELWAYGKNLPKNYYLISGKGRQFLQTAAQQHLVAYKKFSELFAEIDKKISTLDLLHAPTRRLGLAHILEDKIENISFGVFRETLRSWNQLPDDRVLLFKLYSMPFTVDSPTGKTEQSISYVGPLVQKSTPVADVYLTGDGKIVAHNTHGIFVLGADNMGERMCRKMKNSALQINHAGALPPVYCADLKLVLRNDLMLANSPTEIENCAKLGILYNRIIPFDTLQTESIKFYSEPARLIIPKELQSYAIIFLPKSFDPNGIRRIR